MRMPMLALLAAVLVLAPTLAQAARPPDCAKTGNWEWYSGYSGDSCYLFFGEKMTWGDAKIRCSQYEALLADLHAEAENSFILQNSMMIGADQMWLGGLVGTDGSLTWMSGKDPDSSWSKWNFGEPKNYQSGNTRLVSIGGGPFNPGYSRWRNAPMSDKYAFACERPSETERKKLASATTLPPTSPPTTQPTTVVGDCFTKMPNTQAHVADQFAGIDVLDDCLKKCIGIGCKSLDWDAKNPAYNNVRCWIYTPPRRVLANETNPITGVDHYDYIEGCGT